MKKITIKDNVLNSKDYLQNMTNLKELYDFAIENNYDNKSAFSKYKKALLMIGINYNLMKSKQNEAKEKALEEKLTHQITIYTDAKAKKNRFALTTANGDVIWGGYFYDEILEQSESELESAKKAVWLANYIKNLQKLEAIRLNLFVDAEWLTWANSTNSSGGKALELRNLAKKYNVLLNVDWVCGKKNPADFYTTQKGYMNYKDYDLLSLLKVYQYEKKENE